MNQSGHFHAVRFYQNAESLSRLVAEFVGEGLVKTEPAILIATPDHAALIMQELESRSFDLTRLEKNGDLFLLDAEKTLNKFMIDGMPDHARFERTMVPVIEKACRNRQDCTIRAYGEMVDVLWKRDQTVAATRLEMLWNDLASTHQFSLLCGYSMGNFYKATAVEEICGHHSHVVSDAGESRIVN